MNEPVVAIADHLRLPVRLAAGVTLSRFGAGLRDGRIEGNRCAECRRVYVPPRPFCSACWRACDEWLDVPDRGVVDTFVIVNVPFYGQQIAIPYVLAHIRLDGTDASFLHLVGVAGDDGTLAPPPDVRIGMPVRAVWRAHRTGFFSEDVDHFTPAS